jgi:hypothetical protein
LVRITSSFGTRCPGKGASGASISFTRPISRKACASNDDEWLDVGGQLTAEKEGAGHDAADADRHAHPVEHRSRTDEVAVEMQKWRADRDTPDLAFVVLASPATADQCAFGDAAAMAVPDQHRLVGCPGIDVGVQVGRRRGARPVPVPARPFE